MEKYSVYAVFTGSKFLGEVEATTREEAKRAGEELNGNYLSLCHHCSREFEVDDASGEIYVIETGGPK